MSRSGLGSKVQNCTAVGLDPSTGLIIRITRHTCPVDVPPPQLQQPAITEMPRGVTSLRVDAFSKQREARRRIL